MACSFIGARVLSLSLASTRADLSHWFCRRVGRVSSYPALVKSVFLPASQSFGAFSPPHFLLGVANVKGTSGGMILLFLRGHVLGRPPFQVPIQDSRTLG